METRLGRVSSNDLCSSSKGCCLLTLKHNPCFPHCHSLFSWKQNCSLVQGLLCVCLFISVLFFSLQPYNHYVSRRCEAVFFLVMLLSFFDVLSAPCFPPPFLFYSLSLLFHIHVFAVRHYTVRVVL